MYGMFSEQNLDEAFTPPPLPPLRNLPGQLLLLLSSDLLPLALFLLEPLQLLLLLAALISPGVDVFLELLVEFIFVHASLPLGERLIALSRGGGGVGHTIVIHPDTVFYVAS